MKIKKQVSLWGIILIILLLASCATKYNSLATSAINYPKYGKVVKKDSVEFSYVNNILELRKNKKYAKICRKKGVQIIAVQLINNSSRELVFGKDIKVVSNDEVIMPLNTEIVHPLIKQKWPKYLPYLSITPLNLYSRTGDDIRKGAAMIPIGIVIGPGTTIANTTMAGKSDKRLNMELLESNLQGRKIGPYETVNGLIGYRSPPYLNLNIEVGNVVK